jgi:hypothetical protein
MSGKVLAFGNRGTYNPANREKGSVATSISQTILGQGACQDAWHSQDSKWFSGKQSLLAC